MTIVKWYEFGSIILSVAEVNAKGADGKVSTLVLLFIFLY